MAQEQGVVATITQDGWAQVITERRDACGDCGASHCCASLSLKPNSRMAVKALNRAGAKVGDTVYLGLKSGSLVQTAAFLYMVPVVGLIVGAIVGGTLSRELPLSDTASAIMFSFVGLGVGFLITGLYSRWMSARHGLTPVITRIAKTALQTQESLMAIDPVCKMVVNPAEAPVSLVYQDKNYYFCHPNCRESFAKNPEKYLSERSGARSRGDK